MTTPANQPDCCGKKSSISPLTIVLLVGLAVLLLTAFWQARGQDAPQTASQAAPVQQRIARVSYVQGQVQFSVDDNTQPDAALANMPIGQGMTLVTAQDGRAEVQFDDGSVVRVTPNSRLQLTGLSGSASGSLDTEVNLLSGEAYFELNPADGDRFTVDALGLHITTQQPASFRVSWLAQPEQVAVSDGFVHISHASDYSVQVNANETLSIDDQDVTRYLLSTGTDSDANDAWNEQRVQSPDDAGGSADLDAYGSYYDVPGFGEVWQPYGYDSAWDPYDAGYWAWYPWGYTWVSAYPWGWAPYHCGYWNYFPGWGWGWVGGGCGSGIGIGIWYPYGPWHNVPVGWRPPHRPPWRPGAPIHRIAPVGIVKDHPNQPVPVHRVPVGYKPPPVTIGGHTIQPLPPTERVPKPGAPHEGGAVPMHRGFGASAARPAGNAPVYGSRAGNPELGRGGSASKPSGSQSAPASHSSSSGSHSSSPPASHSDSSPHK